MRESSDGDVNPVEPDSAVAWEADDEDRGHGEFYQPVGVGPHPLPWPDDDRLDLELLAGGDRRNVVGKYRYWTVEAIRADLDATRIPLHVAIENWQHDLNIGSIVRTANAFNVAAVHIVGRRRWNRRGAMVTDKYMHVLHHDTVEDFCTWARGAGIPIIGIDNVPGSTPLEGAELPNPCVLFFGNEGSGLTDEAISVCQSIIEITQTGSTRSMNASAAAAITMWAWRSQHAGN